MSNAHIVERMNAIADEIDAGKLCAQDVRDTLLGHTEAMEGVPYAMVKEAQSIWGQLTNAIESGQEQSIDSNALSTGSAVGLHAYPPVRHNKPLNRSGGRLGEFHIHPANRRLVSSVVIWLVTLFINGTYSLENRGRIRDRRSWRSYCRRSSRMR